MSYILIKPVNENQRREQIQSQETSAALNDIKKSITNEINQRQNDDGIINQNLSFLREVVNSEITLSAAADTEIWAALNSTTATLTASDTFIINSLSSETAIREISEGQLRNEFNTAVDNETSARMQADENLRVALLATINSGTSLQAITDENLRNQIASETAIRNAALTNLQAALSSETAIRASEDARVLGAVSTEIANRQSADATLNANLTAAISSETALRNAAINDLRDEINATLADNLNDFTKTKHGLVPVPPSGNAEQILTQNGWRPVTSSTIYINDTPSQFGTLTFNNTNQTPTFLNYDTAKLQISGTTSAKNAGNYIAKFTPKDLYVWGGDNTQSTKDVGWSIQVLKLPKPAAAQIEFDFTGSPISISINNFNSTYINQSGTATATEPGNYTVTYSLKSTSNTKWEDNSTGNVSIAWEIAKRDLTEEQSGPFAQAGDLTFNGQLQTVTISNYDSNYHTLGGTYQSTNAGNFTATVSPKAGYSWFDGSNSAQNVDWSIAPATVARPYADVVSFAFDGNSKNLQVTNYDSALMTQAGTLSATNAGDYTVTYSLKNKNNYTWEDGSTGDVVINWAIGSQRLNKPDAATKTFTYSGDAKTLVVSNFDADFMTESGTKNAIDAGTYTVTYSLKDTTKAKWADGSTADVTITWTIAPKPLTATQSTFSIKKDFTFDATTKTVEINNYDSAYHILGGVYSASDAGTYTATISPKPNYAFNGGSTAAKNVTWQINVKSCIDFTALSVTYTGEPFNVTFRQGITNVSDDDLAAFFEVSGTTSATNAGTYYPVVAFKYPASCIWIFTKNNQPLTVPWTINRKGINGDNFRQNGTLTYNGAAQTVSIYGYNSDTMTISGTTSATNAGDYEAHIAPNSNYAWFSTATGLTTDTRIVNWTINQKSVDVPTAAQTEFAYDGNSHSLEITGFDSSFINKSGDETKTAAGSYQLTFSLKDAVNTRWADGSTENKIIEWSIGMTKISAPIPANINFTFNGNEQAPTFTGYDSETMTISGTQAATNAGTYSVIFNLKDSAKTVWEDNSTSAVSYEWKINRKPLTAAQSTFAQSGELTYNATQQTVTISNYDENYHVLGGDFQKSLAGNYTARVYPADNYCFNDGSTAYKTVPWSIAILKIAKPVITGDSIFIYDKKIHTPTVENYNATFMTRGLTDSSLRSTPANYTYTYILKNSTSCHWADDTTAYVYLYWAIVKRTFAKPAAASTIFTYNRRAKTLSISNFDADFMNVNGTLEATDAGEYTVTYSLKDKTLHTWSDGSTADVIINWTINRQTLSNEYDNIVVYNSAAARTTLVYNGNTRDITEVHQYQTPEFVHIFFANTNSVVYSNTVTLGGTTSAKNAGTYTATMTPTANYCWQDGSTEAHSFTWTIEPITLAAVSIDSDLTYNGTEQSPTITNYVEKGMTLGGYTSAKYAVRLRISITPNENYAWEDGSTNTVWLWWQINRQSLTPEQSNITTSFTKDYTGSNIAIPATECGVDTAYINFAVQAATTIEIGTYLKATATPRSDYCWFDGSTAAKNIYLTIRDPDEDSSSGVRAPLITGDSEFTYDGSAKSITVDFNSNFSEVKTGYLSASDAGEYSVVYKLKSTSYKWKDGSTADKTLTWKINRKPLTETQSTFTATSYGYIGEVQTVSITNFNSNYHEKGGTTSAINAGTYTATVTPKSNYCWADGTFDAQNVSWTITKKRIAKPIALTKSFEYDGSEKSLTLTVFSTLADANDNSLVNASGTTSAINAGSYSTTYSIIDTDNYAWSDNTSDSVTIAWKITPIYLDKPRADITQIQYTGAMITLQVTGYNSATMDTTGDINHWLEGNYTKTYSLKDKVNYRWADGSTADVIINWAITPIQLTAEQSVISQTNSLTFNGQNQSPQFNGGAEYLGTDAIAAQSDAGTYTASISPVNGYVWNDGTKTAKSVEWQIAKAERSYSLPAAFTDSFTLEKIGTGNFSISSDDANICMVKVSGSTFTLTAGKNGTTYITVTQEEDTNYFAYSGKFAVTINRSLADFTWAQIASYAKAGTLLDYCKVGDSKDVPINATIGGATIGGTFAATLIGFNHNSSYEGENRAHFCLGKLGNVNIAFVHQTNYGTAILDAYRPLNSYFDTAFNSELLSALPSDLAAVITACTKATNYLMRYGSSTVTKKIWLLDKFEIDGATVSGISYTGKVQQYDYFKNGNGLTRFKSNAIGTRAVWWTRTYANSTGTAFYAFNSNSSTFESLSYDLSYGVVPCFTVS